MRYAAIRNAYFTANAHLHGVIGTEISYMFSIEEVGQIYKNNVGMGVGCSMVMYIFKSSENLVVWHNDQIRYMCSLNVT